jgi:hypothetical protein
MGSSDEKAVSLSMLVTALVISLIFAIGSSMTSVRKIFTPNSQERKILAKALADYNQKVFVIFKIRTQSGIEIEIYEKDFASGTQNFKQRFPLSDDSEAYLMVNSNSMNLGLVDVNNDGQMDIVAPTVDKNGNSRLNVFEFNNDLNSFIPYTEQQ